MRWKKLGLVFSPETVGGWMKTHAQVPTPLLGDEFIRIYFSSRPQNNLSLTSFLDLDLNEPTRIIHQHPTPILELGKPGTFDEHGVMPSCAIQEGSEVFLYYSGWSRGSSVPYTNSTGLAISKDGGITFAKVSDGPILGKSIYDPYSATSPCVLREKGDWHMWYCSGTGWLEIRGKTEHTYDVKHARSTNGVDWKPEGAAVIEQRNEFEAITRPYVYTINGTYHMLFCYRGSHNFRDGEDSYRIGHASSTDLVHWVRSDEKAGISVSESGWDSKMIAYPAVVQTANSVFLFYNGNGFGRDGFGCAVLEESN